MILPPVRISNLGSDLSINNIVRLGLADTNWQPKFCQEGAGTHRKVKNWNFRGNSKFFSKFCWKHDIPLESLGIHFSGAFYSTLLSFFVLKIFGFN